jgi:hypothetical protein
VTSARTSATEVVDRVVGFPDKVRGNVKKTQLGFKNQVDSVVGFTTKVGGFVDLLGEAVEKKDPSLLLKKKSTSGK